VPEIHLDVELAPPATISIAQLLKFMVRELVMLMLP
jgi:hypothetical protein